VALLHDPYPDEDRQRAFEIWYIEAGRSPKATSNIMKDMFGVDIRPNTISEWTRVHDWHTKANNMLAMVAPGMKVEMLSNLLVAGVRASRLINEMITDASNGVRLDGAASKLAIETMHLAGFSPIGTRNPLDAQRSAVIDRSKLLELYHSDEEIAELMEQGRRALEVIESNDANQLPANTLDATFRRSD
jgi:hypothetical protein